MHINVTMADGTSYTIREMLTPPDGNTKLAKTAKSGLGWMNVGLSLAAANESGYQVCPHSTPGCRAACIYDSGYARVFGNVKLGRIAKTRAWFQDRAAFKAMLVRELAWYVTKASKERVRLACRLNVFSDIPWERVWPEVFSLYPDVQFYDYTKDYKRAVRLSRGEGPVNYDLTFSRSERNHAQCLLVLKAGGRVAVPFSGCGVKKRTALPVTWEGFPVINADETDLRFLDPRGVWCGLYAKAKGTYDETGFVVPTALRNGQRIALPVC